MDHQDLTNIDALCGQARTIEEVQAESARNVEKMRQRCCLLISTNIITPHSAVHKVLCADLDRIFEDRGKASGVLGRT